MPTASGRRLWGLRLIIKTPTRLRRRHARWPRRRLGLPVMGLKPGPSQATSQAPGPGQHPGSVSRQQLGVFWGDWTQRMATDSATKRRFTTSPKSTVQPKVDRNRRRSASERQSRGGTGWSVSASECTIEEADSEYPCFQSNVIKSRPPAAATALWPSSSSVPTRPSEVAQLAPAAAR